MNIVFVVDATAAIHVSVVVESVRRSNPDEALAFHVVSRDPGVAAIVPPQCVFHHLAAPPVNALVQKFEGYTISNATMDRLLLPEVLEPGRYLYLDVDVAVHRYPLGPLFAQSLVTGLGAAYTESIHRASRFFGPKVPDDFDSFNAGVLLFDLPQAAPIFAHARTLARTHGFNDQMALNYACGGAFDRIPLRANIFVGHYLHRKDMPGIHHWAGAHKPWDEDLPAGWHGEVWAEYATSIERSDDDEPNND